MGVACGNASRCRKAEHFFWCLSTPGSNKYALISNYLNKSWSYLSSVWAHHQINFLKNQTENLLDYAYTHIHWPFGMRLDESGSYETDSGIERLFNSSTDSFSSCIKSLSPSNFSFKSVRYQYTTELYIYFLLICSTYHFIEVNRGHKE